MNSEDRNSHIPRLDPLLVSFKAGCRLLGVGPTKMYELISAGIIKSKKIGAKRLIDFQSLKRASE